MAIVNIPEGDQWSLDTDLPEFTDQLRLRLKDLREDELYKLTEKVNK